MDSGNDIKFIFNTDNLKQGDILLINSYTEPAIQKRLSCKYDHVAVYMGDAFILEADGLCATMNHIHSYGFRDKEDAIVMRLKDWNQTMIDKVLFCARMKMGMEYGTLSAYYKTLLNDNGNKDTVNTNKTFCTRFVAQAYNMAGVNIVKNPEYCIPDDFIHSKYLCEIEDVLTLAEDDEIDEVNHQLAEDYGKLVPRNERAADVRRRHLGYVHGADGRGQAHAHASDDAVDVERHEQLEVWHAMLEYQELGLHRPQGRYEKHHACKEQRLLSAPV